jgi:hypothetical protein
LSLWARENSSECGNFLRDRLSLHPEEAVRVLNLVPNLVTGFDSLARLIEPEALAEALKRHLSSDQQKGWSDDYSIVRDFLDLMRVRPEMSDIPQGQSG